MYRFGFNGKEKDDEWTGVTGSHLDFGARIFDSRIGRWLATDPLAVKYPNLSPYNYTANNPILFIDPDGKKIVYSDAAKKSSIRKQIRQLRRDSEVFNTVYKLLDAHDVKIIVDEDAQYLRNMTKAKNLGGIIGGIKLGRNPGENGGIVFGDGISGSSTFSEEFFHMYQDLYYNQERSIAETEAEAKIHVGIVIEQETGSISKRVKGANVMSGSLLWPWGLDRDILTEEMVKTGNLKVEGGTNIEQSYYNFLGTFKSFYDNQPNHDYHGAIRQQLPDAHNSIIDKQNMVGPPTQQEFESDLNLNSDTYE